MTMRQRVLTAFAGLAMLIGAAAPGFAAEKVLFMIDWLPAGDKAVPYLGVQKGLFADEGIEVTIQSGRGSSDVVTKLGTGAADMGTGGLAALLQARAQSPVAVKAVASIYTLQPDAIFTTEGSGISTLKDLVGKQIATATFSSSNVSWPLVLRANGIDPASGTRSTLWTTNHSDRRATATITRPFAQIFAVMISAGVTGMTSRCSMVQCSRSRISAAPVRTTVSIVMLLITAMIPRNHSE